MLLALGVAAAAMLAACGAKPGDVARGEQVFNARCWNCHEKDTDGYALAPGLKNYFSRTPHAAKDGLEHTHSDEFVREFIRNGSMNMPPQKDHLSAQELADVMAYLKTL